MSMLQINQDLTNITYPDFADAVYAAVRQAMLNGKQINNDHAVE